MKNPIGIVVPNSINTPKKYAKKLNKLYPAHQLSKCQAVTAKLYGHQDWFNLENAIKNGVKSAPFNDDLDGNSLDERLNEQIRILARELGNVDMDEDYMPIDIFTKMRGSAGFELADKRFEQFFADTIIFDMTPTDKNVWSYPLIPLGELVILEHLPTALSKWWLKNIPSQPEVANALGNFILDAQSRVDLLEFGRYWGVLSRHYAQSLPDSLKMGIAYMLADRYAALSLSTNLDIIVFNQDHREGLMGDDKYAEEIHKLKKQEIQIYLNAYPIDRYAFLNAFADIDLLKSMRAAIKLLQG